ncbi:uncharacterized protein LOC106169192 [Lingula anatina]|uniref:Uncharacterized protein LOC106169192 n=1 Tax=Lingula anatina TaxID=7574 RepID=A0A1S3J198_LINAN|nr:uncharacterized protein LOC106169192 [Lingula anatina]|eukprot:XP_013404031.1 uncharacterized protein LOC106169192 [Lingula anatina]
MNLTNLALAILCLCVSMAQATKYGVRSQQQLYPGKPVRSPVGAYGTHPSLGPKPLPAGPLGGGGLGALYRNQMVYDFGAECPVPVNVSAVYYNYRDSFIFDMPSHADKTRYENDLKKYAPQHYDLANKLGQAYSPREKPQLHGYSMKKCDMCPDKKSRVVGFKWNPNADYNANSNYHASSYQCWIYWPQAPVYYVECATKYCNKPRVFGWIHRCNPDNFQTRTVLACCYDAYTNAYSKAAWFELDLPQSCECYDYACPHDSQKVY